LSRPTNALRQLSLLAENDDFEVSIAIALSLGDLLTEGTIALAGRVLTEVAAWASDNARTRQLVGRLAFYHLTTLQRVPSSVQTRVAAADWVPTLLALAMYDRRFIAPIAALWRDGLNSAQLHRLISDSLTCWAELVDRQPEARSAFIELLRHTATDRRTGSIVVRLAGSWGAESGSAPRTAEALVAQTGVHANA
jgi:hypothetical protein